MGLMRWFRGGDENSATANAMGAGMAEIDALFRPSKHKQSEHIQESRRRRVDINNGAGSDVDLDTGTAVIRQRNRGGETAMQAGGPAAAIDDAVNGPVDDAALDASGEAARKWVDDAANGATDEAGPDRAVATDSASAACANAGPTADGAPRRQHPPITRRGASVSPATLTVSAAAFEPND